MYNDIKKDLSLFNDLALKILKEENNNPIATNISPNKINETLDLTLNHQPTNLDFFKKTLEQILINTPKSSSKLFFNQLFGGRQSKAVLGDLLSVFLNNSMATYKIAGPQVAIEKEIIGKVCKIIGYPENSGGTFPTGGSMSNFMSLIVARDKFDSHIKSKGTSKKLIIYTSENGHYSISKNVSFSGIGKDNIRILKSDFEGKICPLNFERQIEKDIKENNIPFYLNATAGTTVLCAFDPVKDLSKICKKHGIWLHLDGAFGGTVIFSEKYKYLVNGIQLTNSFCFNAHKTLGAPLSTSVLLIRDKEDLYNSFKNEAEYLYQTHSDQFNLGQTSFECGRRNNALKFWTLWKAIGTYGLEKIIDHEFNLAEHTYNYVNNHPEYTLHSFKNSLSICFNYKDYDPIDLCTKLYEYNTIMVGFGSFKKKNFIRLVIVNSENTTKDIDNFFSTLEAFCIQNNNKINKIKK
tara:strand:- start:363 stop:1757 length:1395 start_codon:yes stop_codon:yes gene_type:complete